MSNNLNPLQLVTVRTIHNLFVDAKINKKPLVIVEGYDDPKKYNGIFSKSQNTKPNIKPSELIYKNNDEKYVPGYKGVIAAVKDLCESTNHKAADLIKFALGVVDKDASNHSSRFGGNFPILFTLKYYSIESYFISSYSVKLIYEFLICGESDNLTSEFCDNHYNQFKLIALNNLFYPSIEALKNSCIENYGCILGYSAKYENVKNRFNDGVYNSKLAELDEFYLSKDIAKSFDGLFDFCKGKWFIACFTNYLNLESKKLKTWCSANKQCIYCVENIPDKCVYKIESNPQDVYLEGYLYTELPKISSYIEFDDIVNRYDEMFL